MLYVSSTENVYQYVYDGVAGTATGRKTLVTGMTVPGTTHPTRSLLVSRADPDLLLVQRGSNGNLDADAAREEIGRSVVRYFNISDVAAASQPFATGGSLLGMGLRNSEAIGENVPRGEFVCVYFIHLVQRMNKRKRKSDGKMQDSEHKKKKEAD